MNNVLTNEKYISDGWKRCESLNTNKDSDLCYYNISAFDLNILLDKNKSLITLTNPYIEQLEIFLKNYISILLVNKEGYILKVENGSNSDFECNEKLKLRVGGRFREDFNGNTSMSTAVIENKPIALVGEEHYCSVFHEYATLSAPIYKDKEIIGLLSMIGFADKTNNHTLGMLASSARAISVGLESEKINQELMVRYKYENAIVESITDGLLIVDKDGFVNYLNQIGSEILCVDREKSIGKHINQVVDFRPVILEVLSTGKGYVDKEFIIKNAAGIKLHFIKTAVPIKDEDGNVVIVVDTFRKIKRVHKLVNEMTGAYSNFNFDDIIGKSRKLEECIKTAKIAASSMSNVLITGESGTGKELIAHSIHSYSSRNRQPFVTINCGAIPRDLLESELFGYEAGSFTGASTKGRIGKFELADGGTIFLDEIGEMPIDMQVKLLRVIQDRKITRIGSNNVFDVDVRILTATNKDLYDLCKKGLFREDLYYRINVLNVHLPPLRERKSDIHELTEHFLRNISRQLNKEVYEASIGAMEIIMKYDWPGNIRELENILERSVNICQGSIITEKELDDYLNTHGEPVKNSKHKIENFENEIEPLETLEKRAIQNALFAANGNITATANLLKVTRNTIYNKMKKYNLEF
nr:sigma 54-interacting transcriptional regulator [Sedimentibacter acidaminivorans]